MNIDPCKTFEIKRKNKSTYYAVDQVTDDVEVHHLPHVPSDIRNVVLMSHTTFIQGRTITIMIKFK